MTVLLTLSGCGGTGTGAGSGPAARRLLAETFASHHPVTSGVLDATVAVVPHGSRALDRPISLTIHGPFQSAGAGRSPQSAFAIAISFQGHTGRLGIISTGGAGYVTLGDTAYALPAGTFRQIEGGVSALGGAGPTSGRASGSALPDLGIHPQTWLTRPEVVGTTTIGGTETEHVHGDLAVGPLLDDISRILSKASSVNAAASAFGAISPATRRRLVATVTGTSFDLWTGSADHVIRRLRVRATLPVTGRLQTELGGLSSATLQIDFGYSQVDQPQSVSAPTTTRPFSEFRQRLSQVALEIEQLALSSAGANGANGASGATG